MVYAIGRVQGKTKSGHNLVVIENCPEKEYIGTKWANSQTLEQGLPYMVSFDPQDQFCFASMLPKEGHS
jgi:hypothetical protein